LFCFGLEFIAVLIATGEFKFELAYAFDEFVECIPCGLFECLLAQVRFIDGLDADDFFAVVVTHPAVRVFFMVLHDSKEVVT